ncbi:MAG: hypothetical protein IKD06_00300 [Clostridia bacterium]|nr:hypothetical protein [Clostridia bacterium]
MNKWIPLLVAACVLLFGSCSETPSDQRGFVTREDGHTYYYSPDGFLCTGWVSDGGNVYRFDTDGRMLTGWQELEGKTYWFAPDGVMARGKAEISGVLYYFDGAGALGEGLQRIDGALYLFDKSGAKTGFQTVGEAVYYFGADGKALTGWQTLDDGLYHFADDGKMSVNTELDGYVIGSDGRAQEAFQKLTGMETLDSNIGKIFDGIMTDGMTETEKLRAAYDWTIKKMRYKYITVNDKEGYTPQLVYELADYSAKMYNGSCEHYAAMMYVMYQRLGYEAVMVNGEFLDDDGKSWVAHVWIVAKIDGEYYHFDPLYGRNHTNDPGSFFMKKDSQIEHLHRWDREKYPVCD